MASVIQRVPATPKQAVRRRARLDRLLEPELFKALAEPTRARLLGCLIKCRRPCSVTEVAACCSIDFSMVSRHLAALCARRRAALREARRTVWYEAPTADLAMRFRDLAESIDEWSDVACDDACGCSRDGARCDDGA